MKPRRYCLAGRGGSCRRARPLAIAKGIDRIRKSSRWARSIRSLPEMLLYIGEEGWGYDAELAKRSALPGNGRNERATTAVGKSGAIIDGCGF